MVHVYELRTESNVEYVGISKNLDGRLYQHTKKKYRPASGEGLFNGRTDLTIHSVSQWPTRSLALLEETKVKRSHGIQPTEFLQRSKAGKSCRLTTYQLAQEIKSKYIPRKYTHQMLANEYNLTLSTVAAICRGKTYLEE